ncbi:EpsG family protein [Bifidobacterium sp. ESL0764]|uniref:EpsG family protein n=1 Tax=Bifidobacterium sp. ESL0764 TaxID=2983228 RepID=UPI0023F947BC|nr:EpsG family protein [Bifidobacterium sp. ESL0764]WEV65561.1 EpsG family protein [Bifidobacterium sp. ESL0764]
MGVFIAVFGVFLVSELLGKFFSNHKLNIGMLCLSMAILILITGLRNSSVGTDSEMYVGILTNPFKHCPTEIGYCIVNRGLFALGLPYTVLFLLEGLILYTAMGLFIYWYIDERWWMIASLLLIVTHVFFYAMNASRQYLAVALVCLALMFFEKKHLIWAIILVLGAATMHKTALLGFIPMLLTYFAKSEKFRRFSIIAVVASFFLQFINYMPIFTWVGQRIGKYQQYQQGKGMAAYTSSSTAYWIAYSLAVSIVYVFYIVNQLRNKEIETDASALRRSSFLISGSLSYVVLMNVFAANWLLNRLSEYFIIFFIWLLCACLQSLSNHTFRITATVTVLLLFTVACFVQVYIKGNYGVLPYLFFFQ